MIKGCQREMILLQTKQSPFFESAYFVLRRGRSSTSYGDMVAEANRLIGEGAQYLSGGRRFRGWIVFLLGALCGGGIFALILAILQL